MRKILSKLAFFLATAGFCAGAAAVFDPVNDDTDLFRNNPNIPSERPNVLIILDNTANWNTAFTNEKSALVSVFNSLDSSFNLGLMMFPETGGGNDSIDGGYVRFGMRQMTTNNKSALYEPLVGAACHALATVLDRARHGSLPASVQRAASVQHAATIAASLAGRNDRWPEFHARLYADADEPKRLVLAAIALGWSEKWRSR